MEIWWITTVLQNQQAGAIHVAREKKRNGKDLKTLTPRLDCEGEVGFCWKNWREAFQTEDKQKPVACHA